MDIEMTEPGREQSRARYPDSSGYIKRDGVRLYYEVYGSGEPTVLLCCRRGRSSIHGTGRCRSPTWPGTAEWSPSTAAATAVPIARWPGTGKPEFAADALAVMNATATERAVLVSLSVGAQRALLLAAEHPDRVTGSVFIGPAVPLTSPPEDRTRYPWMR